MICPYCSNEIEDDSLFCSICGNDLKIKDKQKSTIKDEPYINIGTSNNKEAKKVSLNNTQNSASKIFVVILAIIGCIVLFISAEQISEVGNDMMILRSEAGTSLAEVYYQDVGKALKGFAMFARGLGISVLAIVFTTILKKSRDVN